MSSKFIVALAFLYVLYIYYMPNESLSESPKKHKNIGILFGTIFIVSILLGILMYIILQNNKQNPSQLLNNSSLQPKHMQQGNGKMQGQNQRQNKLNRQNCLADDCLQIDMKYPAGELSEQATTALQRALDDEYKAQATYEAVIAKIGMERPFSMIIRAEEQHISALKSLFDKYGLQIAENPWTGTITVPASLQSTCQLGVTAETANVKLYKDELLPMVTEYADITTVFTNLMNASQNKHLPAFERCK